MGSPPLGLPRAQTLSNALRMSSFTSQVPIPQARAIWVTRRDEFQRVAPLNSPLGPTGAGNRPVCDSPPNRVGIFGSKMVIPRSSPLG